MRPASSFIVFADESGDHGLARINANYPIFVLSCCIFRKDEYIDRVCPALQRFKLRWWPHDAVVLHSAQIKRRAPPCGFLQEKDRRERFMSDLTRTLEDMPFALIAGVIHKERLKQRYSVPENPYALALKFCMERAYSYLCDHEEAESELHFLVERRGNIEDAELRLVFRRACDGRSHWEQTPGFSIEFVDKKANLAGLQVADLVSTPIGRHVHRPEQLNRAFEMIRRKFWCSPAGGQRGWGYEVFP
ncbi:MAG: DUF3800 domain-containing protein [Steroidobacteraceae bacterium]